MKKIISSIVCAVMPLGLIAAEIDQEAILQRIEAMQKQIVEQQAAIDALRNQLTTQEQVSEMVTEAIDTQGLAAAGGGVLGLSDWIEQFDINGDLRLRYEYVERDVNSGSYAETSATRFRTRARIGMTWQAPSENWEVAAGLITGSTECDDYYYGGKDGNSGNDSWNQGDVWETGDIYLDYAYAKHSWDAFSLTIGQQKNPFTTTWMMFDPDLRPTGATAMYCSDLFFVTTGAYNLRSDATSNGNHQSLANLYAAQLGIMLELEPVNAMLAVSYFHYDNETTQFTGPGGTGSDYRYQIGAVYGQVGVNVEDLTFKLYGEIAMNFGADNDGAGTSQLSGFAQDPGYDSESEDLAWIIGAEAKAYGLKLHYAYVRVEGDSIPAFVADSDWAAALMHSSGTGIDGHKLGVSYDLTKHCTLGAAAILTDYLDPSSSAMDENGAVYQMDLTYKF